MKPRFITGRSHTPELKKVSKNGRVKLWKRGSVEGGKRGDNDQ